MGGRQKPHGEEKQTQLEEHERREVLQGISEGIKELEVDSKPIEQKMQNVGIIRLSMNGSGMNLIFDDGGRFTLSVVMVKKLLAGQIESAGISFCDKWNPKTAIPKSTETTN